MPSRAEGRWAIDVCDCPFSAWGREDRGDTCLACNTVIQRVEVIRADDPRVLTDDDRERLSLAADELDELAGHHGFQARITATRELAARLRRLSTWADEQEGADR